VRSAERFPVNRKKDSISRMFRTFHPSGRRRSEAETVASTRVPCRRRSHKVSSRGVAMAAAAGVKVTSRFNMILNAGKATPQPPVGSALGQRGLNLMNFCKAFNDETAKFMDSVPIRVRAAHRPRRTPRALRTRRCKRLQVRVTAYADRTFTFQTQGPSSTYLLLKAAGIEKGADKPGYETVGRLSVKHIYEIAKVDPSKIE